MTRTPPPTPPLGSPTPPTRHRAPRRRNWNCVASNIKFDKASLTAKADQPFTITLTNNDTVEHNITIEDLKVNKDVEGGKSETSDSVTPAAGTYEYHCEYHPSAMKGQLIVS